ncbi:ABC transporter ATP-binding protein [Staphylococcus kloosii]|jgi:ABC-2 type transport system ATP-binding protein|uniref:ABC transporter ATP-binding protein n=1 Tax=Staphylococcus kloosii TaxID=29384 RepID=UPI0018A08DE9|nr:ABC transporter ATP-binding protein [Staphylococcus kloosii]MBF7023402.1 ABC transporter ATP-binding protein [Staphylococcus kloosii]
MNAIETKGLEKRYGNKTVVNKVDLRVSEGDIFGFLGKNGAGKSTFINMITGLCTPSNGTYKLAAPQNKIGVLPDYSNLYDDFTSLEHLLYFNKLLKGKKSKNELIALLTKVGLGDAINLKAKKFSFGMKKKLGFAQTLINDPTIVFLDEPTSGLDANSILTIHKLILELAEKGTTVFFTSHNLDEVEKLSNTIAIMDKGNIIIQGDIDYLKKSYESELKVKFTFLNSQNLDIASLENQIDSFIKSCEWGSNSLKVTLTSKEDIPEINEILVANGYKIYEIVIDEPSLEEIFINTGKVN